MRTQKSFVFEGVRKVIGKENTKQKRKSESIVKKVLKFKGRLYTELMDTCIKNWTLKFKLKTVKFICFLILRVPYVLEQHKSHVLEQHKTSPSTNNEMHCFCFPDP